MSRRNTHITTHTLPKAARLKGEKNIQQLFSHQQRRNITAHPLRMVYILQPLDEGQSVVSVLFSVPKRRLHHATDRNRAKRQMREAMRQQLHTLQQDMQRQHPRQQLRIALIWQSDTPHSTPQVAQSMHHILQRLGQQL